MPFVVPLAKVKADYPEFTILEALTPSEQKAAFHVCNGAGEHLCLKIIAPDCDIDRVAREIDALQQLDHPNVVRLREYTFSSKVGKHRHYMVEEFVAGSDLRASLVPGSPWSRPEVAKFFASLSDGLGALRTKNIVHRDLKPTNIRVRPDGSPVVIDFGLARHLGLPDITSTSAGAAIGTPAYFAPEQADPTSNKHNIDHRTDLFALGIMLYEAILGAHPFLHAGMSCADLCAAICGSTACCDRPEFLSLPEPWRLIVSRLLEKERARRPHDPNSLAAMLRKIGEL